MKFRVADIAYPFALFATSVGAFGFGGGLLASLMVALFWLAAFKQPRTTIIEWLVIAGIIVVLLGLLLPAFGEARIYSRVAACHYHMKQLAIALHSRVTKDGGLPQAIVKDEAGNPVHSWRISILPFMEEQLTFDKYDWSQPWNSPKNAAVLNASIEVFVCPGDPPMQWNAPQTNYFAIVGSQTAWPEERGLALSEITDDSSSTILVLEVAGWEVPWGEPRDLTYDEAFNILIHNPEPSARFAGTPASGPVYPVVHSHHGDVGYFYKKKESSRGVHAAFADGRVRFLPVPLPDDMAKALLTAKAGDEVDWDEFERLTAPQLDYAKIYATIAFAIVALWPARRLLRQRPA